MVGLSTETTQTSIVSALPRSWSVRSSRSSVLSLAAVAAAWLTSTSPSDALEASRAAVFTESPSAVKSCASPSPTEPTYATPVCTAAPTGIQGLVGMTSRLKELLRGRDRLGGVVGPGKPGDEKRDDLVAHELVDDSVSLIDDRRSGAVEPRH